jgi:hypothetical protein
MECDVVVLRQPRATSQSGALQFSVTSRTARQQRKDLPAFTITESIGNVKKISRIAPGKMVVFEFP